MQQKKKNMEIDGTKKLKSSENLNKIVKMQENAKVILCFLLN